MQTDEYNEKAYDTFNHIFEFLPIDFKSFNTQIFWMQAHLQSNTVDIAPVAFS